MNKEILKKFKPVCILLRNYANSSQSESLDQFFKFYSDSGKYVEKYKPLGEQDYGRFISSKAAKREPALTRLITTLAYKVGRQMLSLAEGMPNEDAFPYTKMTMELRSGDTLVLEGQELSQALQYVPSQGLPSLLTELRSFQNDLHRPPPFPRDVMVVNGGQHGIYQCIDLLLEPGDPILTTQFAYTGLHTALKPYSPEVLELPEDKDGLITEVLDSLLGERLKRGLKMPKVLYINPTGNNPTGTVLPEDRKRDIYEMACRYDFLIIEDDPYMFLNYSGEQIPSFLSMDVCGRVIRLDSISKVISSGLRGGWVTAPNKLLERLELHSQAEILHSCSLAQVLIFNLLANRQSLYKHLLSTREMYKHRRDTLFSALSEVKELSDCSLPTAGLFFWMKVHGVEDVYNMVFRTAFDKGLMLIPGQAFIYGNAPCHYLRLTFSKIGYADMNKAVRYLADIIRDEQKMTSEKRGVGY